MSNPKMSFSVLPVDEHRLILEINDGSGSWQLPIDRDQAKRLGSQLQEMTMEPSKSAQDLQKSNILEHREIETRQSADCGVNVWF